MKAQALAIEHEHKNNWMRLGIVAAVFAFVGLLMLISASAAGEATLSLVASDSVVRQGDELQIDLRLNTDEDDVNAIDTDITFDQTAFEFVAFDQITSSWDVDLDTVNGGVINIVKGTTMGSVNETNNLVATIRLRALGTSVDTSVQLTRGIIVRTSDGEDVFSSATDATVVVDNTAPSISVESPTNNQTVGASANLAFNVSDNNTIERVEVLVDSVLVSTITNGQYSFTYNTSALQDGNHTVSATAYDVAGNSTETSTITFVKTTDDTTAPTVTITAPADNTNVTDQSTVQVAATATDDSGSIDRVVFYGNNAEISTDTTAPYAAVWDVTGLAAGTYQIRAEAFDPSGNGEEATVSVVVDEVIILPVTVDITNPVNNATVSGTTTVSFETANVIAGSRIDFLVNGNVVDSDTVGARTFSWDSTSVANGSATLQLSIAGSGVTSDGVTVTVANTSFINEDIDQDGSVNVTDLSILIVNWGRTSNFGRSDVNGSGRVDIFDLSRLLSQWTF